MPIPPIPTKYILLRCIKFLLRVPPSCPVAMRSMWYQGAHHIYLLRQLHEASIQLGLEIPCMRGINGSATPSRIRITGSPIALLILHSLGVYAMDRTVPPDFSFPLPA